MYDVMIDTASTIKWPTTRTKYTRGTDTTASETVGIAHWTHTKFDDKSNNYCWCAHSVVDAVIFVTITLTDSVRIAVKLLKVGCSPPHVCYLIDNQWL